MNPRDVFLSIPPLRFIDGKLRRLILNGGPLPIHLSLLFGLYLMTFASALREGAVVIRGGIGLLQNPPFFIHLLGGIASIPLVFILLTRVLALPDSREDRTVVLGAVDRLRRSRTAVALYGITFLLGLLVLAYNVVLGFNYDVVIYDSPRFPLTFASYQLLRVYLYLVCYPVVFFAPPLVTYYLFERLRRGAARYQPFHVDGLGGFRKYFVAVDRPIYVVQTVAVLIAVMNYLGWGRMEFAPFVLAIAAPLLATLLGLHLFVHFNRVVAGKRRAEIRKIRLQQTRLYSQVDDLAQMSSKNCLELIERLEATERLAAIVARNPAKGLRKYLLNLVVLVTPYVSDPLVDLVLERILGS